MHNGLPAQPQSGRSVGRPVAAVAQQRWLTLFVCEFQLLPQCLHLLNCVFQVCLCVCQLILQAGSQAWRAACVRGRVT